VFRAYEVPRRAAVALIVACTSTLVIVGSWHIERGFYQPFPFMRRKVRQPSPCPSPGAMAAGKTCRPIGSILPVRRKSRYCSNGAAARLVFRMN